MSTDTGPAPAKIFLLIGLTREAAHWDDGFVAALKARFATDAIVGLDIPGNGSRRGERSPTSIPEMVAAMRSHHRADLATPGAKVLVAVSLGGMIGASWLTTHPEDFSGLVIINSSFNGLSPLHRRVQPRAMRAFLSVFAARGPDAKERATLELCSNHPHRREATLAKWAAIGRARPVTRANIVRQALAGARCRVSTAPVKPVLVVAARHDRLAHVSCSEAIARHWGGELHVFEDLHCGHALHIDAGVELAEVVHRWAVRRELLGSVRS